MPTRYHETFLIRRGGEKRAPETFETKGFGQRINRLHFRVQVDPLDCTGCSNCADVCPAKDKALIMQPAEQEIRMQGDNWELL